MERLNLPATGLIYLDAAAFIYSVERVEPYRTLLEPVWRQAPSGRLTVVSSELVVLETLVKPLRDGNRALEELFRSLLDSNEVRLIPATLSLWEQAADIRVATRLKTPDSLHAASAIHAGCNLFITNDIGFRRVPGLACRGLDRHTYGIERKLCDIKAVRRLGAILETAPYLIDGSA